MMKKAKRENTHFTEKAKLLFVEVDFADTFSTTNHFNTIEEIANLVFSTPKWINNLFKIRNFFGKFLGLKVEKPADLNSEYRVGGYIHFFKIYDIEDNEIILGEDDSHLNFRIIINNTNSKTNNIKVTTFVKFNNKKGKMYMKIIKPFHQLIVKTMVRQAYSNK